MNDSLKLPYISLYLIVTGEFEPTEISLLLQKEPTTIYWKGDPTRTGRVASFNLWSKMVIDSEESLNLESELQKVVALLRPYERVC